MYFLNALFVMCGIACGMPLLFVANRLSRKYLPDSEKSLNQRSVELMEERNRLDVLKCEALQTIVELVRKAQCP